MINTEIKKEDGVRKLACQMALPRDLPLTNELAEFLLPTAIERMCDLVGREVELTNITWKFFEEWLPQYDEEGNEIPLINWLLVEGDLP